MKKKSKITIAKILFNALHKKIILNDQQQISNHDSKLQFENKHHFNVLFNLRHQQTKSSMHLMILASNAINFNKITNKIVNAFDYISIECNVFNNK